MTSVGLKVARTGHHKILCFQAFYLVRKILQKMDPTIFSGHFEGSFIECVPHFGAAFSFNTVRLFYQELQTIFSGVFY